MHINTLKVLFLALFILISGCGEDEDDKKSGAKDDKKGSTEIKLSATEEKNLKKYSGKWRYVHNGSEFNLSQKNIQNTYFLASTKDTAPDEYYNRSNYVFLASDENLLEQKRKDNTSLYLVRDGIKNTQVKGQISRPQTVVDKASVNPDLVFTSNVSKVGNLNTILKNIKTDDIIELKSDTGGNIASNAIPTGEYLVSVSSDKTDKFEDKLVVSGADTDLGVLNIADEQSLNFKITGTISNGIFQRKTTTSTYSSVNSNDLSYDYYRGQYVFPLGDLEKTQHNESDPYWVTVKVKNISKKIAEGAELKIHCDENTEQIIDCGGIEDGNLFKTLGTIHSDKEFSYRFWLQVRPFNTERKDIVIPVSITTADSIIIEDKIVLPAYKKQHTIKVALASSNNGYIFLPGRNSIRLTGSSAYINLPFINSHTYQLLYSNDSSVRQSNYSIANGYSAHTMSSKVLRESKEGWNSRYEPKNNIEETAPEIKHGQVLNAYLHTGDLDYYKIVTKDEISITPALSADALSKDVLEDKPVAAATLLKFNASIIDKKISKSLVWEQIRGPKVDYSVNTDGTSFELTTPSLPKKETLTFKVSFQDTVTSDDGNNQKTAFDYLSITVNPSAEEFEELTSVSDDFPLDKVSYDNLILNNNDTENNNNFVINYNTELKRLIVNQGVTLTVKEGNTLTINNQLAISGATLVIEKGATLDLSALDEPVIPVGGTLVLDGNLSTAKNLTVRGTITHSEHKIVDTKDIISNLTLDIPGKLTVAATGKIDVTGKGLKGGNTYWNVHSCRRSFNENGYGTFVTQSGDCDISGGSHGGLGVAASGDYNKIYGNKENPTTLGLGGVSSHNARATPNNGGGVIKIEAQQLIVEGEILAEGSSVTNNSNYSDAAGAGGSILIQLTGSGILESSGIISVKGGISGYGNHGGGGRLAIKGIVESSSKYNKDDWKGFGGNPASEFAPNNGTIYIEP